LPDLKRLGPRLGKQLPKVKKMLSEADGSRLLAQLEADGHITLMLAEGPVMLDGDDIQVRLQAKPGWAAAQGRSIVVVLATELTPELIREGLARELIRTIQDHRKEMGCDFTDRITIGIVTDSAELNAAVKRFSDYIRGETLAMNLTHAAVSGVEPIETTVGEDPVKLYVKVAT
jgi:isoleucyl-tRNA synthetase